MPEFGNSHGHTKRFPFTGPRPHRRKPVNFPWTQAAVDAGKAAEQVADPANDAVQQGSPYVDTDSAAALVVLSGQGSKTIAEQQRAVADAHAKNAAAEAQAQAAKNIADQASGDAKEAYQHAAGAAQDAAARAEAVTRTAFSSTPRTRP
ncbi:hypothetical protein [Streptomyces sp. NPDC005004]